MAKRRKKGDTMGTITFRPPADLRAMLDSAVQHLGVTTSDLVNDSLRLSLVAVINARARLRAKGLEQFQREFLRPPGSKTSRADKTDN